MDPTDTLRAPWRALSWEGWSKTPLIPDRARDERNLIADPNLSADTCEGRYPWTITCSGLGRKNISLDPSHPIELGAALRWGRREFRLTR